MPSADIWQTSKHKSYVVLRYDRMRDTSGELIRIHQEDFCQALGHLPSEKYESEGGPGFEHCFDLIGKHSMNPIVDKQNLIMWAIFNFLIGNSDAHAKNISLLITEIGYRLAPFYDLMCTRVYENLSHKMAMKIGGHYEADRIAARHWAGFAASANVKDKIILGYCNHFAEKLPAASAQLVQEFTEKSGESRIVHEINTYIQSSSARMSRMLKAG